VKITGQVQGHLSESSRSLCKVMSYSVVGSEIPSVASSFTFSVSGHFLIK